MITKKYTARKGSYINNKDAEVIGIHVQSKLKGITDAELFVKTATPKRSPVHRFFEWDNKKAGHQYRLQQARNLLHSIEVEVADRKVRAFHNVVVEDYSTRQYVDHDIAINTPDLWEQVLNKALREIISWKEQYENLQSISKHIYPIVKAIEKVANQHNYGDNNEKTKGSKKGAKTKKGSGKIKRVSTKKGRSTGNKKRDMPDKIGGYLASDYEGARC